MNEKVWKKKYTSKIEEYEEINKSRHMKKKEKVL